VCAPASLACNAEAALRSRMRVLCAGSGPFMWLLTLSRWQGGNRRATTVSLYDKLVSIRCSRDEAFP